MNIYDTFETDKGLEADGVWIPIGDMQFKLKHVGGANKGFSKAIEKVTRQYRQDQSGKFIGLKDEAADQVMFDLYARHIIVDWKGVLGRDGEEVQFSILNAIKIFTDLPRFFKLIQGAAENIENFKAEVLETDAGNLEPS